MTARLHVGACVVVAFAVLGPWLGASLGCGGGAPSAVSPAAPSTDAWPPLAALPHDAIGATAALASADGEQVRVRAYLVAVTLPCPACSVGERTGAAPDPRVGKSRRPPSPSMPGCLPCPNPAATFSDEGPAASATSSAPLRAVGAAEGLQPRHVGKVFLLTGTFHAKGPMGPELDVTDVQALDAR